MTKKTEQDYKDKIEELNETIDALHLRVANQSHHINILQKHIFGKKSERFVEVDPNQGTLDINDSEKENASSSTPTPVAKDTDNVSLRYKNKRKGRERRKGPNRNPFPEHLERVEVTIEPSPEMQEKIDKGEAEIIGYEQTKQLCRRSAFYVKVIKRPKIIFKDTEAVSQKSFYTAELSSQPIERSIADISLFSWILVSRYCDHMPFYRLQMALKREKIHLNRSTVIGWIKKLHELLLPIYQAMSDYVKQAEIKLTDDTGYPAIYKKTDKEVGRVFVFIADSCVVYDFQEDKSHIGPLAFLKDSKGYLVSDDAPNFMKVVEKTGLTSALCWAHARRKFVDALSYNKAIATEAIERMQPLFKKEKEWKEEGLSPDEIVQRRQSYSKPIVESLEQWCKEQIKAQKLLDSPIRKALGYFDSNVEQLKVFLRNGAIPMTNNGSERAVKTAVLSRKNSMFFVSEDGGKAACLFYSLFETCKNLDINPTEYIEDVLEKVQDWPMKRVSELTPMEWVKTRQSPPSP